MTLSLAVVILAGFFGGALNAVAGGGSFLTLPALLFAGLPPVAANATGTVSLLPGYIASAWGYRHELRVAGRHVRLGRALMVALAGGALGAGLLLLTSNVLFRALIPWLLLVGTALFVLAPRLTKTHKKMPGLIPGLGVVSTYGGYFNGGLGILFMAWLGLSSTLTVQQANALKNLLSAGLTVIAAIVYLAGGVVHGYWALLMMLATMAGGLTGAHWGRKLPDRVLRFIVIATGAIMTTLFFLQT